jgi:hypothetical protein
MCSYRLPEEWAVQRILGGGSVVILPAINRYTDCPYKEYGGFWAVDLLSSVAIQTALIRECSPVKVTRSFGGTYHLHLHGETVN